MGMKLNPNRPTETLPMMGLMSDLFAFGVRFEKPDEGNGGGDNEPSDPPKDQNDPPKDDPKPEDSGKTGDEGKDKDKKPDDGKKPSGEVDDEKAKLLKDLMKKKERLEKAEANATEASKAKADLEKRLNETNERLARALGVESVEQLEEKIGQLEKDEESRLAAAGEWDKLKERLVKEHKKQVEQLQGTKDQQIGELQKQVDSAESEIRRLLVSNSFAASGFIQEELTLSPHHAERLFGENFKVEATDDGRRVVKAVLNGEPLVDSNGNALSFDDALKEIVNADPAKDNLFRPKAKPGSGSGAKGTSADVPTPDDARGQSRIARALSAQK